MQSIFLECNGRYNGAIYSSVTVTQVAPSAAGKVRFRVLHHVQVNFKFSAAQDASSDLKITAASGAVLLNKSIYVPALWDPYLGAHDAVYYVELDNFGSQSWTVRLDDTTRAVSIAPNESFTVTEIVRAENLEALTLTRTSSPSGFGGTGELSAGAWIYAGDVLKVDFAAKTGYAALVTLNGGEIISGSEHTVSGNVSVISSAEPMATISIFGADGWETYMLYVYSGTAWELHQANVFNGSEWEKYY